MESTGYHVGASGWYVNNYLEGMWEVCNVVGQDSESILGNLETLNNLRRALDTIATHCVVNIEIGTMPDQHQLRGSPNEFVV